MFLVAIVTITGLRTELDDLLGEEVLLLSGNIVRAVLERGLELRGALGCGVRRKELSRDGLETEV